MVVVNNAPVPRSSLFWLGILFVVTCIQQMTCGSLTRRVWIPTSLQFHCDVSTASSVSFSRDFSHVVDYEVYEGCVSFGISHPSCVPCQHATCWVNAPSQGSWSPWQTHWNVLWPAFYPAAAWRSFVVVKNERILFLCIIDRSRGQECQQMFFLALRTIPFVLQWFCLQY